MWVSVMCDVGIKHTKNSAFKSLQMWYAFLRAKQHIDIRSTNRPSFSCSLTFYFTVLYLLSRWNNIVIM